MQKFVRWLRKDQSGFTLIELLVVVAILALLGAVAIPRIVAAQDHAKDQAALANKGIIEAAAEQYYIINGGYPAYDPATDQIADLLDTLEIDNATQMLAKFNVGYTVAGDTFTVTVSAK